MDLDELTEWLNRKHDRYSQASRYEHSNGEHWRGDIAAAHAAAYKEVLDQVSLREDLPRIGGF